MCLIQDIQVSLSDINGNTLALNLCGLWGFLKSSKRSLKRSQWLSAGLCRWHAESRVKWCDLVSHSGKTFYSLLFTHALVFYHVHTEQRFAFIQHLSQSTSKYILLQRNYYREKAHTVNDSIINIYIV